jgi:hypothetical protein
MVSPLFYAMAFAVLMAGLLIEVAVFRLTHGDHSSTAPVSGGRERMLHVGQPGKQGFRFKERRSRGEG